MIDSLATADGGAIEVSQTSFLPLPSAHPRVLKDAVLSDDGLYRYELRRVWEESKPVTWVMLNPSTADADVDDPTIRRCMAFARSWGYGGIRVVNLFAFRATDPKGLAAAADPFGPDNNRYVIRAVQEAPLVVVGWGAWYGTHAIDLPARTNVALFAQDVGVPVRCLGTTKAGAPRHPLYVKGDQALLPWPATSDSGSGTGGVGIGPNADD